MINDQFKPRPTSQQNSQWTSDRITSAVLIAANIIPLIGVAFYQWDLVNIMLLYWLENILIGFMNIVRIVSHIDTKFSKRVSSAMFFTVHYGLFCLVHGMLLFTVLDLQVPSIEEGMITPMDFVFKANIVFSYIYELVGAKTVFALFAMILSHGVSLLYHYFMGNERERLTVGKIMNMPYKRIVSLHIGLMAGMFLIEEFGAQIYLLIALVAAKILFDVKAHRKEHRELAVAIEEVSN